MVVRDFDWLLFGLYSTISFGGKGLVCVCVFSDYPLQTTIKCADQEVKHFGGTSHIEGRNSSDFSQVVLVTNAERGWIELSCSGTQVLGLTIGDFPKVTGQGRHIGSPVSPLPRFLVERSL